MLKWCWQASHMPHKGREPWGTTAGSNVRALTVPDQPPPPCPWARTPHQHPGAICLCSRGSPAPRSPGCPSALLSGDHPGALILAQPTPQGGAWHLGIGLPLLPPKSPTPGCGDGAGPGCQTQPCLSSGSPQPSVCPDTHVCNQNEGMRWTRQGAERSFYFSAVLAPIPLWSVSDL